MPVADGVNRVIAQAERLSGRDDCLVVRPGTPVVMQGHHYRYRTIVVLPGGDLTVLPGTTNTFPDLPNDPELDPTDCGNGLIALGKLTAIGTPKTPFVRRGDSPPIPSSWRDEDARLYPDSRLLRSDERFASYRAKWEVVREALPIFKQPGSPNGEFQPHVANLTRDIVFCSENPAGNRAHVLFAHRAEINVQNCEFRSLGRTTVGDVVRSRSKDPAIAAAGRAKLGHYPVNFHHLWGPRRLTSVNLTGEFQVPQFIFNGNTVWCELDPEVCEFPWGIVLWDSHFGEIKNNVIHNWHGFGIGCLGGNEYGNLIEGNLVSGIHGEQNPRDLGGLDASGFWFRGTYSYVRKNVACGIHGHFKGLVPGAGFQLVAKAAANANNVRIPKFPGADTESTTETVAGNVQSYSPPADWWQDNEAYGCGTGLTFWDFTGRHIYARQTAWNCHDEGVYLYPHADVTFFDPVAIGCDAAMRSGDYLVQKWDVRNPRFVDCKVGIGGSTNYRKLDVTGGLMECSSTGVQIITLADPGAGSVAGKRLTTINGTRFGSTPTHVAMRYDATKTDTRLLSPDECLILNYNGESGKDLHLYYPEQRGDFVIPKVTASQPGVDIVPPEIVGLTNQQAWDEEGRCIAGAVAPATVAANVPKLAGLVEWLNQPKPENKPPLVEAGEDLTIQWPEHIAGRVGIVSDDGFGPGPLSVVWSQLSGPSAVIGSPASIGTAIEFSGPGIYVFRLLASDGELTATDTVTITVLPPPPEPEPETVTVTRDMLRHLQSLAKELYQSLSLLLGDQA